MFLRAQITKSRSKKQDPETRDRVSESCLPKQATVAHSTADEKKMLSGQSPEADSKTVSTTRSGHAEAVCLRTIRMNSSPVIVSRSSR